MKNLDFGQNQVKKSNMKVLKIIPDAEKIQQDGAVSQTIGTKQKDGHGKTSDAKVLNTVN